MVKLEHLNLKVKSIEESIRFYQTAFPHWAIRGQGKWQVNDKPGRWLHLGDDHQYLTLNDNGDTHIDDFEKQAVGLSHFAFEVRGLNAIIARLTEAGFIKSGEGNPTKYRDNVYFVDPSGFEIEFVEYFSDDPVLRNEYV